jgi:peptidoglycan/LPS O-acetylase OafA/YrhL
MINSLTSLRFFAALMIYCSHLYVLSLADNRFVVALYKEVFYEGYLAVTFFFMLSGFVLTYGYKERFLSGAVAKKYFYISRLARIYPLHFLTLLLAFPLWYSFFAEHVQKALVFLGCNLLLMQSFIPMQQCYYFLNEPAWALSNEIFFYGCFPLLISTVTRMSLKCISGLVLLLALCVGLLAVWLHNHTWLFYINPLFRIYDFFVGIVLANIFLNTKDLFAKIGNGWFTCIEVFAVGMFASFFAVHRYVPENLRSDLYYVLPIAFIIFVFAFERGFFSKAIASKGFVLLGRLSFAFYMLHLTVMHYVGRYIGGIYAVAIGSFFITLMLSIPVYFFYEQPLNRILLRKYQYMVSERTS